MLTFDALRFAAASGIVIHHSNAFLYTPTQRLTSKEISWGLALFVDLFFLISGYVIAFVYGGRTNTLTSFLIFLQKRVARLLPLHLVTLFVFAAIYFFARFMGMVVGTPPDLSTSCLLKTALLLHAISPCEGPTVNAISWSISAEMAMYVIFPIVYFLVGRDLKSAFLGLIFFASLLLYTSWGLSPHEWTSSYAPLRALPSFCVGVALFRLVSELKMPFPMPSVHLNGAVVISIFGMLTAMLSGASATTVLLFIIIVSALSAVIDKSGFSSALAKRTASLGQLTYSVYMIHFLLVTAIVNVVADKILGLGFWPMLATIGFTFGIVLFFSLITYTWIEKPARRWLAPKNKKSFISK